MKQVILTALSKATGINFSQINLEFTERLEHGDYTTNVALQQAQKENKKPLDLAQAFAKKLTKDDTLAQCVSKVDIAGPGFINFYISKDKLIEVTSQIDSGNYGKSTGLKDKTVVVEYTDPNPFKEFHIGHLMPNIVGETLCRILEFNGASVKRVNYQGDIGMHVAKAVWGLQVLLKKEQKDLLQIEKEPLEQRVKLLGEAYVLGATSFEDTESASQIRMLNKKIFEKDAEVYSLYQKGRQWSLDYFETIYEKLGTKFDKYYFESEVGEIGKQIVLDNLDKGVFEKSEGAVIFLGEKFGLHNRVFINSLGLPTYEAKELGLAPTKYQDFKYDESIIVTGNEIDEYFKVLITAMKQIMPDLGEKTKHFSHGMLRLTGGKMSSRKGNVILAEDLIAQVKSAILERMRNSEFDNKEVVAEQVAIAAIKYSILRVGVGKNIIFDIENSISVDGESGPYLQYTYARTQSVLLKSNSDKRKLSENLSIDEENLVRFLSRFPGIIESAAKLYSPNYVANYLFDLAQMYNSFYNNNRIIGSDNEESRLVLTLYVGNVLKTGLYLLGIQSPSKM